jgi:hypothetical protein
MFSEATNINVIRDERARITMHALTNYMTLNPSLVNNKYKEILHSF